MNKRNLSIFMTGFVFLLAFSLIPTSTTAAPSVSQSDEVIVYALPYEISEYSVWTADSYGTAQWNSAVYAALFKRSSAADRDWVPDLAADFPTVSTDGLNWTIDLQPNLKFSNGNPLTTSDVVFSLKVQVTPAINLNTYGPNVGYLNNDSITVHSETSFTITFEQQFAFLYTLASFAIIDEDTFSARYDNCIAGVAADCSWNAEDGSDNVSAGPFMVEDVDNTNEILTAVANPYYYDADNVKTDKIVFQYISEATAAISALAAGDIDIMDAQYVPGLTELDGLDGVKDDLVGDPSHQEVSLNHLNPYFGTGDGIPGNTAATTVEKLEDAKLVRYAMSHIVNRDFAANNIMEGMALPAATAMPSASLGWDSTLLPRNFSVDVAKNYMEMAGFDYSGLGTPDSQGVYSNFFFSVTVLSPNTNQARNQWSTNYVAELPKIGIGVTEHVSTDWDVIIPRTFGYAGGTLVPDYANGGFDVFFVGYGWALDFNPTALYDATGRCDTGDCGNFYNFDVYENQTNVASLVTDYLTELDFDTRLGIVKDLQAELFEWEPVLPILYPQSHWGFRTDVVGVDSLLISVSAQEWDQVYKTGFSANTVPDTTSVANTDTSKKDDSPLDVTFIISGVFFTALIATYVRKQRGF